MSVTFDFFVKNACPWCQKQLRPLSYSVQWEVSGYRTIPLDRLGQPLPDGYLCAGHKSEECPTCRWMVVLDYHTPEQCAELASLVRRNTR